MSIFKVNSNFVYHSVYFYLEKVPEFPLPKSILRLLDFRTVVSPILFRLGNIY